MNYIAIFIGVLFALFLCLIIFFFWRKEKKREKDVENYQRTFFRSVIQILEFDRMRISKDLHDEIGTTLSIIKMNINKMIQEPGNADQNKMLLAASKDMLENVIRSTRDISQELMSPTLVKLGYEKGIVELGRKIGAAEQIRVDVTISGNGCRMPQLVELEAYRIIQEVLNNVIKHAEASMMDIAICSSKDKIVTRITHDGLGISSSAVDRLIATGKGVGLKSIKNRLELIDASIEYFTNDQNDSLITVTIPIHETN
jgi:signal transduction histidine kinase